MVRKFLVLAFVAALFPAVWWAQETVKAEETVKAQALSSTDSNVVDETETARIDWTEGYVEARGQAVAPSGKQETAQGKLLARRGAVVDLQRNLLEFLQGVRVDARTTMKDFMTHDTVRTEVQGMIKNIEILEASWDGEVYTVVGRVKLEKVRRALLPALPEKPSEKAVPSAPAPGRKPSGSYTGLVVDARHLPLIPAMTFRVVDESGREVYSLASVDRERFLSSGLCDYHNSLDYAKGAPRVSDAPVVVKALRVVGPENVDLVVSNGDAARIRGSAYDFRVPCRVSVVKR
ncbi:MAG: hypothetical protein PHF19_01835 [Synergistales bacterium]|nr:hypothetical protein [Synergistales bacterium]